MKIIINGEIVEVAEGGSCPSTPVTPITSAEYEALSDADKQADVTYLITDDNEGGDSGGGSSEEIYSTEEVRIGRWIDGRPLYRKVFPNVPYPSTTANEVFVPGTKKTDLNIRELVRNEMFDMLYTEDVNRAC